MYAREEEECSAREGSAKLKRDRRTERGGESWKMGAWQEKKNKGHGKKKRGKECMERT